MTLALGVRGKLFLVSCGLILVVGLASGLFAEAMIERFLVARLGDDLGRAADAARIALEDLGPDASPAVLDARADALGAALEARVTFVDEAGRVVGDSELPLSALASVENHAARPEVAAASASGSGRARRTSATIGDRMLYVAVAARVQGGAGVVRVADSLDEVDAAVAVVRGLLALAGLLGLGVAVLMSGLASHMMTRTLRGLLQHVRVAPRAPIPGAAAQAADEIGGLAKSFSKMAEQLESTVSALRTERDRFEAVLDAMGEAVVALDDDGRIALLNKSARTLFGLDEGSTPRTLLEAVRAPALEQVVERARAGDPAEAELTLPQPPHRRVLARAASTRASGGVVVVLHDVTEIRRLETMRRDFVANVSHELRTPVSVVLANAETLLDGALDDGARARGFVEGIHRNADRLARLLADLLDISRIEAGQMQLQLEPVSLRDVCRRAAEGLGPKADEKSQRLEVAVEPGVVAFADRKALDQVVTNLLDNAIKYTQAGGFVRVSAARQGDAVRLQVEDDGPGVEPRHRDRLFERFYRVDAGRSRELGGTGLGLAIVKHLVEAMGGRVGVEGRSPRGSVFFVTLPSHS